MTAQLPIEFDKTPAQIITMDGALDALLVKVDETLNGSTPDLSTGKGRKEIASLAQKIARTKTAVDAAGKEITEDARKQINAVNEVRKRARDELDKRRDLARKPLTDWEEEQEALKAKRNSEYQRLVNLGCVGFGETSQQIKDRIASIEVFDLGDWWGDMLEKTHAEWSRSLSNLNNQFLQAEQSEKQAIELADMKRQQEEADRKRLEAEAKAKAEREARERIEREAEETKARQDREAKRAKEAEETRKKELADAEKRARKAEQERIAAKKLREEQAEAKRRSDAEHHDRVVSEAVEAISSQTGLEPDQASKIIELIEAGQVPRVSIQF